MPDFWKFNFIARGPVDDIMKLLATRGTDSVFDYEPPQLVTDIPAEIAHRFGLVAPSKKAQKQAESAQAQVDAVMRTGRPPTSFKRTGKGSRDKRSNREIILDYIDENGPSTQRELSHAIYTKGRSSGNTGAALVRMRKEGILRKRGPKWARKPQE